jgi:hypothetical protein
MGRNDKKNNAGTGSSANTNAGGRPSGSTSAISTCCSHKTPETKTDKGTVGDIALDLAQFRARQGAARDEAKETKKGQSAVEKRETHSQKRDA